MTLSEFHKKVESLPFKTAVFLNIDYSRQKGCCNVEFTVSCRTEYNLYEDATVPSILAAWDFVHNMVYGQDMQIPTIDTVNV